MTNDYKRLLLNYLTEIQPGQELPPSIVQKLEEIPRNLWTDFLPRGWSYLKIEGLIKSNTSDKVIFYGGYVEAGGTLEHNSKGIIIVTDGQLNPIQTIYEFSSGTPLRPIQCLYQEEDGQFIGIDSSVYFWSNQEGRRLISTSEKRVIMLNDISIPNNDTYEVNLRTSYIFGDSYKNFICKEIFKNPNSSHYAFAGSYITYNNGTYSIDGTKIIFLKINVGSANEWSSQSTASNYIYGGAFVYFDSEDRANWKILITKNSSTTNEIVCWNGQDTTVSGAPLVYSQPSYWVYIDSYTFEHQVSFLNENKAYFVVNNQNWGISGTPNSKYIQLMEIDFTTWALNQVYSKYLGEYDYSILDSMYLQVVNGELYIQYCSNVNTTDNTADYYIQRYNGVWLPNYVSNGTYYFRYRDVYISQSFNLLSINLIPTSLTRASWYMVQITDVYNIANYNGNSYENYNSLKGKYGNIYSNDKLVFSRNLHNISITNNYSVASVEIPNTYLNDISLNLKELVGDTNYVLIEEGKTITKNIYEVLYLNYINTINVIDNDGTTKRDVAQYINTNINTGTETNYNNTKCTKVCVNYTDNTNKIFPIFWNDSDETHSYTEFTIYVDKAIESIDFISNDETTTYITVTPELEIGKYYNFSQKLRIE